MDLLKFFFKDEVPAIGLSEIKREQIKYSYYEPPKIKYYKPQAFKPNYSNNFFLL
mgnify:CR=1 FL=1